MEQTEEDSPSGLWRTPGTRVGLTPSGVQIPYPPPMKTPEKSGVFVFKLDSRGSIPKYEVLARDDGSFRRRFGGFL